LNNRYNIPTFLILLLLLMTSAAFADLTPPTAGATQVFNVFGHGFFQGYYQISATLQGQNANTYIFVEDAKINDIDINISDDNKILLATESGIMYTDDGGSTWTHLNGETDLLPDGTRSGGADAEPQHRATVESIYFYADDDWMAGVGRGHYDLGDMVALPPYRTKNSGVKWSSAGSGCPSYTYDNVNDETNDYATVFEMLNQPTDEDNFFGASVSGVLSFEKRKWETWPGAGLPQVTAEWDYLPVYDFLYDTTSQVMTAATLLGLYEGTVDLENEQVSWKPLGNGNVTALSVATYNDSTLDEYDVVVHDTTSLTFSDSIVVNELEDGSYSVMVDGTTHLVDAYLVTANMIDLIVTTTTLTDSLIIEAVSPRVKLDGDDILSPNQWVTVNDASNGLYWVGKARFAYNEWYVDLNEDGQYFADFTLLDPDTIDYIVWLPDPGNLVVSPAGSDVFSTLASDGSNTYLGSDHGVYVYDGTTLSLDEATSGLVVNDMLFANDMILAGTETGLFQLNAGTWTKISPLLTDGYSGAGHEFNVSVRSIAVDSGSNLYFGGPLGGFYKSADNGVSWITLNSGLTHRAVTLSQVQTFSDSVTTAVYADLISWLGEFPDVDGDEKIYTLLMDIDDLYYNTAGDGSTYIKGEILTADLLVEGDTLADANSNHRDIIYVDINPKPADDPLVFESTAFQLAQLILYNADNDEAEWVNNGIAGLAAYIVGLKNVAAQLTVLSNNSLTLWSDALPVERDYEHTFIFMDYLYENYLTTPDLLKALVSNTENGLDGLQATLSAEGFSETFNDIYKDFSLAVQFDGLVDGNGDPFGDGKYNFSNLVISNGSATLDWGKVGGDSPYSFTTRENSASFFKSIGIDGTGVFWSPGLGEKLVFNMDDGSSGRIFVILSGDEVAGANADVLITELDLDARNRGIFDNLDLYDREIDGVQVPGTYHVVDMLVITYDAGTVNGGAFAMHDLDTDPQLLELGVSQSTISDEYIDIYGFGDSRIFDDGGMVRYYNLDDDPAPELEGPEALVTDASGDTVYYQTLAHFHIDDDLGIFGYKSSLALPQTEAAATYSVTLSGENLWGGRITTEVLPVAAIMGIPGREIMLNSEDENALLRINPQSLLEASMITLISNNSIPLFMRENYELTEDVDALSGMVQLGPSNIGLNEPVSLTLSYDDSNLNPEDNPQVYELFEGSWTAVPGFHNAGLNEIRIETDRFGSFQVRKAGSQDLSELPLNFALHGNYPNPFNPSTTIRYDLATESMTSLVIYNLLGQEIHTLVNAFQPAGFYSVSWNGESRSGKPVSSGVYLMRLNTDKGSFNHKMVYMK